jgi:hypothetical protein
VPYSDPTPEPVFKLESISLAYVYGKYFHLLPVVFENSSYSRDPYTGQAVCTTEFIKNDSLRRGTRSVTACGWGRHAPMTSVPNIHRLAHTEEYCKREIDRIGVTPVMLTYIEFLRLTEEEIQEQIALYSYVKARSSYFGNLGQWDAIRNTNNVFFPQP